jgi:hypothetical protein
MYNKLSPYIHGFSDGAMDSPFVVNQVVRCPLSTAEVCE